MNRAFSNIRKQRVVIAVIGFLLGAAFLTFWLTQGRTSQDAVSTPAVPATVGTTPVVYIWFERMGQALRGAGHSQSGGADLSASHTS
jgi:hypothetical protein